MNRNCKDCDFVINSKVCELCREPSIYDDMGIDEEQIRADERAKINKHIDELKEIYSLMVKYFSWVNIFNEKTELEKLALKISTDGMRVLGSIIDEYKGTLAGTYERETCEMLRKVFVDADMLVEHDERGEE